MEDASIPFDPATAACIRRRRRRMPQNWRPDADGLLFAAGRGVNVLVQYGAFRDHHRSAGILMVDWNARWRVWCRDVAAAATVHRSAAGDNADDRR